MIDFDSLLSIDELFVSQETADEIFSLFAKETDKLCRPINIVSSEELDRITISTKPTNRFQIRAIAESGYVHLLRLRV